MNLIWWGTIKKVFWKVNVLYQSSTCFVGKPKVSKLLSVCAEWSDTLKFYLPGSSWLTGTRTEHHMIHINMTCDSRNKKACRKSKKLSDFLCACLRLVGVWCPIRQMIHSYQSRDCILFMNPCLSHFLIIRGWGNLLPTATLRTVRPATQSWGYQVGISTKRQIFMAIWSLNHSLRDFSDDFALR